MLSIFCILPIFVVTCLQSRATATCSNITDCFSKVLPGKLERNIIKTVQGFGYRNCFYECSHHESVCASFNYNKFTGSCELNSRERNSTNDVLVDVISFVYSMVPAAPKNDTCRPSHCTPYQKCIALKSGATTCVDECPKPDPLDDKAKAVNTDEYFKPGETIAYTCPHGYIKVNSLQCLANGVWKDTSPLCAELCTFEGPCESLTTQQTTNSGLLVLNTGPTPSSDTGCNADHTTGSGQYYLLNASSSDVVGTEYRLVTRTPLPANRHICLSFWFHMYGNDMGKIRIRINVLSPTPYYLSYNLLSGDHGQLWQHWSYPLRPMPFESRIKLILVKGTGTKSDICLDDVAIYPC